MQIVEAAISLGLPVFPCKPPKKHPACTHGFHDAQTEPQHIRSLWREHYGSLIGVPTGAVSGFVVIDFDPQGLPWMRARLRARSLPATRVHQTPRGGFHFLYLPPDIELHNSTSKLAHGVDIRGEGGYIIHPPSGGYEVIDESPIAPFPRWVVGALSAKDKRSAKKKQAAADDYDPANGDALESFVRLSKDGTRNTRTFWAACRLGEAKADRGAIDRLVAAACSVGLDEIEARRTVESGLKAGRKNG